MSQYPIYDKDRRTGEKTPFSHYYKGKVYAKWDYDWEVKKDNSRWIEKEHRKVRKMFDRVRYSG